ncbi:MAG: Tex family protein [Calditrichia bacterium]
MTEQQFIQLIADELQLRPVQVKNTVELLDSGNTVPFIARYRKEMTGKLDEEQIRAIQERLQYLRMLEERKQTVLKSIESQDKLTPELKKKIEEATRLQEVEDLYLPYKPKKKTRGTIAKAKGLEPLALLLLKQETTDDLSTIAAPFIDEEKGVTSVEEAVAGARDIIAEMVSDDADVRQIVREMTRDFGTLVSKAKDETQKSEYELYYDFSSQVRDLVPHRILAINRGERENILKVSIKVDTEKHLEKIQERYITNARFKHLEILIQAIEDAFKRLIFPSIEREIRSELTQMADTHAITVFAKNLRNLLLQPPVKNKIIMGIDPGYRTGCKVAVIDKTGKYLEGTTIFPHEPQSKVLQAKETLRELINKYQVDAIAIGNGTASRETEMVVAELLKEMSDAGEKEAQYIIVNEAGASVYSASPVAKEEFPDLEASMRGNISIARRLLDPLAELVKIDPKHIGVGLYQHDVNQKQLAETLDAVVESAVNYVGVDLNTASFSLLKYVAGLSTRTAKAIVAYREANGAFKNREELKKVPGIGDAAFQQAAGFLRIPDGDNPLDNTAIHPESYLATEMLLEKFAVKDVHQGGSLIKLKIKQENLSLEKLAEEAGIGVPTLEDILTQLEKPGRDPREALPAPIFKSDVLKMEDLKPGMLLKGTIRNVVDFGAFVDIGVKRDGLIHISEMANKFVRNPHDIVSVGDVVEVKVLQVDIEKGRINLSMKI